MHLAFKRWFGRKQSVQILVGHGGATNTWCWGCHALPHIVPKAARGWVVLQAVDTRRLGCLTLGARARPARLATDPSERVCRHALSSMQTSTSWVCRPAPLGLDALVMYSCQDPRLIGPASTPNFRRSIARTQFS